MTITPIDYQPADALPVKAGAAIKAGQFVVVSGGPDGRNPVCSPAGADAHPLGVAAYDCDAGEHVTVYRVGMYRVAAAAGIAAGDPVSTAAGGKATKATTGPVIGVAVSKTEAGTALVALK